jgi:putative PEP-CTERM system histidine kinase
MFEITLSAISSFFLLVLSLFVILKKRSAPNASLGAVLLLLLAIELMDRFALVLPGEPLAFKGAALFFESLLPAAFLAFSLTYARQRSGNFPSFIWVFLMALAVAFPLGALFIPLDDFFYSPDIRSEKTLFLGQAGYWFYTGLMVYCVASLVNIEATFAVSSGEDRWRMKFEVVGISAVLAVLVFYFSQGLLYRTINMDLLPARSGVMILAFLLIGYSRAFRGNDVRVEVSRYVVHRSLALLVIGIYFLALGVIGEGMRYLDVSFGRDLTIFIAFAGAAAVLLVLFSEKLRRKARVIINKNFYAQKHDYRNEWLRFTGRLSSCKTAADVQGVILATCREALDLRGASLYLAGGENKFLLRANQGMPEEPREFRASDGMLAYFMDRGRAFSPFDGEYVPDEEEAFFVRRTGAALTVPLIGNDKVEGLLVFGERLSREEFIYEDYDLMKTLARQAALSIKNFSLSEELAEAREMAAVARISSFVIHDLKNLASSLSVLLDNAQDYMDEPDFQKDTLKTIGNTVARMKSIMQRLKTIPQKHSLRPQPVDLAFLSREAVGEVARVKPGAKLVCRGTKASSSVDVEEMRKVVMNLLLNAVEACNGDGVVRVGTGRSDGMAYVRVEDSGCGIDDEFMKNHLFKPFRTTKQKGLGIGLYQCKQIAEAHGGRLEVESEVGRGSVFTVYLPAPASRCTA